MVSQFNVSREVVRGKSNSSRCLTNTLCENNGIDSDFEFLLVQID